MSKRFVALLACTLLALLGTGAIFNEINSNTDKSLQEKNVSAFEASIVEPFAQLESLSELMIEVGKETYTFKSDGTQLLSEELPEADQESLWDLLGQLISLQALTMEESPEHQALEKLACYHLISDDSFMIELALYAFAEQESYIGVVTTTDGAQETEQILEFPTVPVAITNFSPSYLAPALDFKLDTLSKITYQSAEHTFSLSHESELSAVEQSPFISGWFLHDLYETNFSVEYQQMEQFLLGLNRLNATELIDFASDDTALFQLVLQDATQYVHLSFYEGADYLMNVYWQETDTWYEVPQSLVEPLMLDMTTLWDNFIALIPLDAIEKITIEGLEQIEILHTSTVEADTETISHEFKLNGQQIDETIFRKVYQYLAALAYEAPLTQTIDTNQLEAALTITYHFVSEGTPLAHVIEFYELSDDQYAVVKNGIQEFSITKAAILDMLEQLTNLN